VSWLRRLANTLRLARVERDIDRELAFHIAERVDQLRAQGLTESEAQRRARLQFGNPVVQRERTRDVDIAQSVDVLLRQLRYAVRAYGVISYAVTEQRRSIGIRLALGAARTSILRRFLRQGLRVAGVACVTGILLSLAIGGALSRMLYGVSPSDPVTLASVIGIVLVVATLAALIPAMRAASMQPMRTLRED
jgi:hypothetical protein